MRGVKLSPFLFPVAFLTSLKIETGRSLPQFKSWPRLAKSYNIKKNRDANLSRMGGAEGRLAEGGGGVEEEGEEDHGFDAEDEGGGIEHAAQGGSPFGLLQDALIITYFRREEERAPADGSAAGDAGGGRNLLRALIPSLGGGEMSPEFGEP